MPGTRECFSTASVLISLTPALVIVFSTLAVRLVQSSEAQLLSDWLPSCATLPIWLAHGDALDTGNGT